MTDLTPLYKEMAADGGLFRGMSIMAHTKAIGRFVRQIKAHTMLDYGCGNADAYHSPHKIYREWWLQRKDVHLYDPSFSKWNRMPTGKFDVVITNDVLEHIPEEDVDEFIARLFRFAKKGVWASFCNRPAKKFFPDGVTNLHVTQRPREWWEEKFAKHSKGIPFELLETE